MHNPARLLRRFTGIVRSLGAREALATVFEYLSIELRRPKRAEPEARAQLDISAADSVTRLPLVKQSGQYTISVLVPVFNTPSNILHATIRSVLAQSYDRWELCICDDASSREETIEALDLYRGTDPRIRIVRSETNLHIAKATNLAAEFATGDFVAFLDHDDTLEPDALEHVAAAIEDQPQADVLYTDEDKIEADGSYSDPYLKPAWSPEHLCSVAYVLHLMVVRKSLFFELGGMRPEFTGAQDYDLSLRATAAARHVVHIPRVLYHWRKIAGSAAAEVNAKPEALLNARRALQDFVTSVDPAAAVHPGLFQGSFRVDWPVDGDRPVTLLMLTDGRSKYVPGRGEINLPLHALESIIEKSSYKNFKIILLDNGRLDGDTGRRIRKLGVRLEIYQAPQGPFNYSQKVNAGFELVDTEDLILLNDDVEVRSADWIEALLSLSGREGVGAVGARLLYPNETVQHAGVVLGVNDLSAHLFHGLPRDHVAYCGYSHVIRNYAAVTGAVLATRMSLVRKLEGFDRNLAIDFNDIDFCLRVQKLGLRVAFTPFAELFHFEGASIERRVVSTIDRITFLQKWGGMIKDDPYYNPKLPRDRTDCVVTSW